jgi:hypothetical protein
MRRAIAVQMMSGDFDHVETKLGDFLDVFQAVGAPLLLPIRVINAEFQLRLHFEKRCGQSPLSWSWVPDLIVCNKGACCREDG